MIQLKRYSSAISI